MSRLRQGLLPILSLAVFAAGILVFLDQHEKAGTASSRAESRLETLTRLRQMRQGQSDSRSMLRTFRSMPEASPSDLEEIALAVFPEKQVEVRRGQSSPLADGLEQERLTIRIEETELGQIGPFLQRASFLTPPWFLDSLTVRAEGSEAHIGKAVLEMTTFARR